MKKFFSFFENFAFKAMKFDDRATPLEYWCVMPVIWVLIIAMIPGDAREFWNFLLARQVPPLNPFFYESLMLFLITFVPRLSLTVRRLHDSGKSGKWAKLPFVAVSSGLILTIGLGSAILTSNIGNGGSDGMGAMAAVGVGIAFGAPNDDSIWGSVFSVAAILNAIGWDAIWGLFAEMQTKLPKPDVAGGISSIAADMQKDPALTSTMLLVMVIMIATPFVAIMLHFFFMISPSELDENSFGAGKRKHKTLVEGPKSANPFAGYKYLYARSPEQEAQLRISQKQEIQSLYRSRVLGQSSSS
tara:strand:- start:13870 stop:14772 length:903 start_codon:yes stop_codon:yes gene_type:complete